MKKKKKITNENDSSLYHARYIMYVHVFIESTLLAREVCLVIKYILGGEF